MFNDLALFQIPYRVVQEAKFTEPLARSKPAQEEGWNNTKLKGSMVPGYTGQFCLVFISSSASKGPWVYWSVLFDSSSASNNRS